MRFQEQLLQIVSQDKLLIEEPMSKHTTFRVGGTADYFIDVEDIPTLAGIIKLCKNNRVPYAVVGNGSNLLVGDYGFRGVIIQIYKGMSYIEQEDNRIRVGGGTLLGRVARAALDHELSGVEFAAGIPGTMGGAVVMNAGAYGGEMSQVIKYVKVLDTKGRVLELTPQELELGYRTSNVVENGYIVLEVLLELPVGNKEEIHGKMKEYKEARVSKQPLTYPSAGSTFKRPEGHFAGKLIQDTGLLGFQVGGAQVSEKHCGFVINTGGATAADIRELMDQVAAAVWEKYEVKLEPEVKFLGEFTQGE